MSPNLVLAVAATSLLVCLTFFFFGFKVSRYFDAWIESLWAKSGPYATCSPERREQLDSRLQMVSDWAFTAGMLSMIGIPVSCALTLFALAHAW